MSDAEQRLRAIRLDKYRWYAIGAAGPGLLATFYAIKWLGSFFGGLIGFGITAWLVWTNLARVEVELDRDEQFRSFLLALRDETRVDK